ncbi:MAG: PQQ-binding-like beta-propeller repeat protein [Vicinamibacterales bacterium]
MFRTVSSILMGLMALASTAWAQDSPGKKIFEDRCGTCHGADGNGGEHAPTITRTTPNLQDSALTTIIRDGLPARGMPAVSVSDEELPQLIAFIRTLKPRGGFQPYRRTFAMSNGRSLDGLVVNEGSEDAQVRSDDNKIHLLRKTDSGRFREVTSGIQWSSYNGDLGGNRHTTLTQIDKSNVKRVVPKWIYRVPNAGRLQGTPVVADGVMYVTSANECYAIDAGNGRQIWRYQRPRSTGLAGDAASGINRGVALAGDKLFMVTDNAHLIALNRATGLLVWDVEMADWRDNHGATSAPLAIRNLVISGTGGGDNGALGFVAAFDQATGKEAWRFSTLPRPGEPAWETWKGKSIERGGGNAWFTGTYDQETGTLFWPTGNPGPDYNGDERLGDNLYSNSVLALDPASGKLKWYYQFTPHDLWDWDATETLMVINANWEGQRRKLLVQANRNGFFYVFDRENGKLLLAKQFIKNLTWASGIGPDGKPIRNPNQEPTAEGTHVCPSQDGATNWFSPSYNPSTGLYYVQVFEKCSIYTKRPVEWEQGKAYGGGTQRVDIDPKPQRLLYAVDLQSGNRKWELPQAGTGSTWGGTLATSTGLVFFGDDSGAFAAADASTGKLLWSFQANANWHASPMAYQFDGQEYIAIAAGDDILVFGLME